MAFNLYTQAQVNTTLSRAEIAMYLISQKIQNSFFYFNNPLYVTYKDLQYDIYILFRSITYNEPFVTFLANPSEFETGFYQIVGSLINKLKQVDFTGAFGGTINPYFQSPTTVINVTTVVTAQGRFARIPFNGVNIVSITNFQSAYVPFYGDYAIVSIWVTLDGGATYQEDTGTVPTIVNLGGDINKPDSYTWTYPIATTGYVQINGFTTAGANTVSPPITNDSDVLLDDATLNGLYPTALWGQLILLPNVPAKYLKLDNSPTGQWDLQTYTPNS